MLKTSSSSSGHSLPVRDGCLMSSVFGTYIVTRDLESLCKYVPTTNFDESDTFKVVSSAFADRRPSSEFLGPFYQLFCCGVLHHLLTGWMAER